MTERNFAIMEFAYITMIAIIIIILIKFSEKIGNIFIKFFIDIRNFRLHVKATYNDIIIMNRDIDVDYSPAVLSYLYNLKLEPKKDILATILNLYNKKVMTIEKNGNGYNFIPLKNADLRKLTLDEKYIYCHFIENKENIGLFSSKDWEKNVIEEFEKYHFSKEKKPTFNNKIFYTISIVITLITTFLASDKLFGEDPFIDILLSILFFIIISPIIMILVGIVCSTVLNIIEIISKLNLKGKNELIKWIKFKKFIKEYSLIKDRKIEEIVLYEKYIPYAMALGINKEYNSSEIREFVNDYMILMNRGTGKYLYADIIGAYKSIK